MFVNFALLIIKVFQVYLILLKPPNQLHDDFLPLPGHDHSLLSPVFKRLISYVQGEKTWAVYSSPEATYF